MGITIELQVEVFIQGTVLLELAGGSSGLPLANSSFEFNIGISGSSRANKVILQTSMRRSFEEIDGTSLDTIDTTQHHP